MSESPTSSRGKPATRRTMLSLRDALTPAQRADASAAIAVRAAAVLEGAGTVALYAAKGSEVATAAIDAHVRARGGRVVYPRIVEGQRALEMYAVTLEQLAPSRFGLLEPPVSAARVELADVDAYVVPGVAFDRASGARLGWGRGYYDATLVAAPDALRIGVAFACQVVDALAHEPHDVAMNIILTEVATYRVA